MSAKLPPKPRNLTLREARYFQEVIANPDLTDKEALQLAGFGPGVCSHPDRVVTPEMREYLQSVRSRAIEATLQEAYLDAQEVLRELIRTYARLLEQETRLMGLLGHDLADLYDESGALKDIAGWPEVWRKHLITEIDVKEIFERSKDGGNSSWDKVGELKKVKRETTLNIEKTLMACQKEKRETMAEIGRHVDVNAFPDAQKRSDVHLHLHAEINEKLEGARRRAAVIDLKAEES